MSITIRKAATSTILALLSLSLFAAPQTAPNPTPIPVEQPYVKHESLFTASEREFLKVLKQAYSAEYDIFGKVRVADVVAVKGGIDPRVWQIAFNKIKAKHFDFVLCDKENQAIIAIIELDDRSHQRPDRQARDQFLDEVAKATKLTLIHILWAKSYDPDEIKATVEQAILENMSGTPGSSETIPFPIKKETRHIGPASRKKAKAA